MSNGLRLVLAGALGLAACAAAARAADDDKSKRVTFDTTDGVTLEGTFWVSNPGPNIKDKDATVLLLHNIDKAKGGSSHQDGWDDLAKSLSDQGYSVLSFDFRGFGNSHSVSKEIFWDRLKNPQNVKYVKGGMKASPPETIDHKDFDASAAEYYPYLVNDIAAAKAFLDRQNDRGQANTSNLIVVGAGEGATLGAMWMASEWHLKKINGRDPKTGLYTFDDPEGKDLAGAVWLDISPKLGGASVSGPVKTWMTDMAGENKLPVAFVYGDGDDSADTFAKEALKRIESKVRNDNPSWTDKQLESRLEFTHAKPIKGAKVNGSQLLGVPATPDFIVNYANQVLEARGPRESRKHDMKDDTFLWTFPGAPPQDAKGSKEDNLHLLPVQLLLREGS